MFDIVESLQGPSRAAIDSDDEAKDQSSSSTAKQQPASEPAPGRFSLWGMATALAENVKKSTADIAARCVTTVCCSHALSPTSPCSARLVYVGLTYNLDYACTCCYGLTLLIYISRASLRNFPCWQCEGDELASRA